MDFQGVGSAVATLRLSFNEACWILAPQPGIDPESPALQEGFLTTGPPGREVPAEVLKSSINVYKCHESGSLMINARNSWRGKSSQVFKVLQGFFSVYYNRKHS